jgi:hypothetical protein
LARLIVAGAMDRGVRFKVCGIRFKAGRKP